MEEANFYNPDLSLTSLSWSLPLLFLGRNLLLTDIFLGKKPAAGIWMMGELHRQLPWFGSSRPRVISAVNKAGLRALGLLDFVRLDLSSSGGNYK